MKARLEISQKKTSNYCRPSTVLTQVQTDTERSHNVDVTSAQSESYLFIQTYQNQPANVLFYC